MHLPFRKAEKGRHFRVAPCPAYEKSAPAGSKIETVQRKFKIGGRTGCILRSEKGGIIRVISVYGRAGERNESRCSAKYGILSALKSSEVFVPARIVLHPVGQQEAQFPEGIRGIDDDAADFTPVCPGGRMAGHMQRLLQQRTGDAFFSIHSYGAAGRKEFFQFRFRNMKIGRRKLFRSHSVQHRCFCRTDSRAMTAAHTGRIRVLYPDGLFFVVQLQTVPEALADTQPVSHTAFSKDGYLLHRSALSWPFF